MGELGTQKEAKKQSDVLARIEKQKRYRERHRERILKRKRESRLRSIEEHAFYESDVARYGTVIAEEKKEKRKQDLKLKKEREAEAEAEAREREDEKQKQFVKERSKWINANTTIVHTDAYTIFLAELKSRLGIIENKETKKDD